MYFGFLFFLAIISPNRKEWLVIWTKPELVEIGPVVQEKKKSCQFILILLNYLPLGKGVALHLNKTQGCCVQCLVETVQCFRRRRWKCEKFTDRQTGGGNRRSEKITWDFNAGEIECFGRKDGKNGETALQKSFNRSLPLLKSGGMKGQKQNDWYKLYKYILSK